MEGLLVRVAALTCFRTGRVPLNLKEPLQSNPITLFLGVRSYQEAIAVMLGVLVVALSCASYN